MGESDLKLRTARMLKWNLIDRVASQVLYGVTGIVLARLLSEDDFGLVGAVLVFQAFAALFIDSGFSAALIQRKSPTKLDYSTVLWFNIGIAVVIYGILWFLSPMIAQWFQGDERIISLGRVMFLSFILNATAIVQTNMLMKRMDVKMVAVSNAVGLLLGSAVGIWMALANYGAWAIVWQTIVSSGVKSLILWVTSDWRPLFKFSWMSLKSFFAVGSGVMVTSFLNTFFQNIYSFFIGNRVALASLGYYSQSDKWSKMGIMSLTQVITSTFLPLLSNVQDDPVRFERISAKTNRFVGYISIPAMGILAIMAEPIFHVLFGTKWDPSIGLFQLLLIRGVFFLPTALYNNYILAHGKSRLIVYMEVLKDGVALVALILTLPYIAMRTDVDIVYGIRVMLWGQVIAAFVTWVGTLLCAAPLTGRSAWRFVADYVPYIVETALIMAVLVWLSTVITNDWVLLVSQGCVAVVGYLLMNLLTGSTIQRDALSYIGHRFKKRQEAID